MARRYRYDDEEQSGQVRLGKPARVGRGNDDLREYGCRAGLGETRDYKYVRTSIGREGKREA